jgi:FkbM family methyltransferase
MLIPKDEFAEIIELLTDRTRCLLQIGTHLAEEHELWQSLGFQKINYVEPIPHLVEMLEERFANETEVKIWPYAVTTFCGETHFYIDSPTYISGLKSITLETKQDNPQFMEDLPTSLPCVTLSKLLSKIAAEPEMIVIDVQGAEKEVLESGSIDIHCPLIVVELLYTSLYNDQTNAEQVKLMLEELGYILRVEYFDQSRQWSDALFVRKDLCSE